MTAAERDRLDRFDEYVDGLLAEVAQLVDAPACPHGSDPAVCGACDDEAREAAGYRAWDEAHEERRAS